MRATPDVEAYYAMPRNARPFRLHYTGTNRPRLDSEIGAATPDDGGTSLICGFIGCDARPFNPLRATLPRMMHLTAERAGAAWTTEELGGRVGLSRSALHQRFIELVGQPPMQYLAQWRMQVAARLLRDTQLGVAAIALDVGYASEAAFVRAFRRAAGSPPATWRRDLVRRESLAGVRP